MLKKIAATALVSSLIAFAPAMGRAAEQMPARPMHHHVMHHHHVVHHHHVIHHHYHHHHRVHHHVMHHHM